MNVQSDSIVHPGAIGKTAGKLWPLSAEDSRHLMMVLPILIRVNHAIAFYDDGRHYTRDALGSRVFGELNDIVSKT